MLIAESPDYAYAIAEALASRGTDSGLRSTSPTLMPRADPQLGQDSSARSFCEEKSAAEPNQPSNR